MDEIDDSIEGVTVTVLGKACSEYYLTFRTPKQMSFGLKRCAAMMVDGLKHLEMDLARGLHALSRPNQLDELSISWLLYTLASTHEFDELPVRHNEEILNEELSDKLMWGPDTAGISGDNENRYINPEVYEDPHTKCFLLLQAYLEHAELPISDYVNDTNSVIDNIPRLLAAMLSIALNDPNVGVGAFDLVCQIYRTRQVINCRTTVS